MEIHEEGSLSQTPPLFREDLGLPADPVLQVALQESRFSVIPGLPMRRWILRVKSLNSLKSGFSLMQKGDLIMEKGQNFNSCLMKHLIQTHDSKQP